MVVCDMARMHARNRGNAGSKRPLKKTLPEWVSMDFKEVEDIIVRLGKEGKTPSEIGLALRDLHGVPFTKLVMKKKLTQVLEEHELAPEIPENLMNLIRKAVLVQKHLDANKHDMVSKRGLQLIESKVRRLVKYYTRTGKLPSDWKYSPEQAALLVK